METNNSGLSELNEDLELQTCFEFIKRRAHNPADPNWRKPTMDELAREFGYETRQGLYHRIWKWQQDGTLEKARQMYMASHYEELATAVDHAVSEFPLILSRMVDIAKNSKKERIAWEVTVWLYDTIVKPALDQQVDSGKPESSYADAIEIFDPMAITPPKRLMKE